MSLEQETISRYNEIANQYSQDWRGRNDPEQTLYSSRFNELLNHTPSLVLDVGCGTGKDSVQLAKEGHHVVSLDLSTGMLKATIDDLEKRGLIARLTLANMKRLPFADNSFDGLWNMASLVHISPDDKPLVIAEFNRVLRPKGILHLGVQNLLAKKHLHRIWESYWYQVGYDYQNQIYYHPKTREERCQERSLFTRYFQGYAYLDQRHWFYPTRKELAHLLLKNGFNIIDVNSKFARRLRIFAQKNETVE